MPRTDFRLPAEWERQSATLLAWPHAASDWAADLAAIQAEYVELVRTVTRYQQAVLLIPEGNTDARAKLGERPGMHFFEVRYNDTWTRDYGFITLTHSGERLALDFYFNGWGGRHPAALDNRVNTHLARHVLFENFTFRQYLFELEGGMIDGDGQGCLLINWHCLRARHRHLSDREIDHELHFLLNIDKVLGVDLPPMPGDDTDGHIDTLARFVNPGTIVFQTQRDPARTRLLAGQLKKLSDEAGRNIERVALPCPADLDRSLAASYANFAFANDAVLVPQFGSRCDAEAIEILGALFEDRAAEPVPARAMVRQGGGPHCATMHIPASLG